MKRQMKASTVALLVSGCLWALSAGAAGPKQPSPGQCTFDCQMKANKAVEACAQNCPMSDPKKKDAATKCLSKCRERLTASQEACNSSCPKQAATPPPLEGTQKPPAPARTP